MGFTYAFDSALITGFVPIISIVLADVILQKPFQRNHILVSILGLIGVGLIIGIQLVNFNSARLVGDLIVFIGINLWSSSFIFSKKAS